MKHRNWRELAEAVGFVTVVAVLVMIALEERTANRIAQRVAEAEAQRSLAAMQTSLNMARANNTETAKVYAKLAAPQGQLITPTDQSQMRAIARQYLNIARSAQFAFDRGLLPEDQLAAVQQDLASAIDTYPGLHAPLVDEYRALPGAADIGVLEPVARLVAGQSRADDD